MISQRIGCSPDRAKKETTATQFLQWAKLIGDEWDEHSKLDHYLAQIAYTIYCIPPRIFGGKITRKFEDFLIKFSSEGELEVEVSKDVEVIDGKIVLTPEQEEKLAKEKAGWFGALGLKPDGTRPDGMKIKTRKPPSPEEIKVKQEAAKKAFDAAVDRKRNNPVIKKPGKEDGHRENHSPDDG